MAEKRPDRTLGPAHDDFWAYCNRGELRLQHCPRCDRRFWPPAPACDTCGSTEIAWKPMSGLGKVISYCTFESLYYHDCPPPWESILVELEEGPLFLSNPQGFGGEDIEADMPVRVTFLECEDAAGPFKLPVFERA